MLPRTWRGAIVELGIKPPSVEQPRLFSDLIRVPAIMKPSRHPSRRNLPRLSRSQGTRRVNDWEVFGKLVEKPVESTRAWSRSWLIGNRTPLERKSGARKESRDDAGRVGDKIT